MQLYLIRHAHALAEEIDPDRPLSPKGRAQIKKLARFLQAKSAFAPAELWHSPARPPDYSPAPSAPPQKFQRFPTSNPRPTRPPSPHV